MMGLVWVHVGLLVATLIWLRPPVFTSQSLQHWLLAACISFFMPLIGSVMLWLFRNQHLIPNLVKTEEADDAVQQDILHYMDTTSTPEVAVGAGQGDERLNSLHIDHYLDLIMSSRELGSKRAVALLKEALGSKAESARLLAFALYSKKEQGDFKQLDELIAQLKQGQAKNPRLHLAIAQLYWHLLDSGLVDAIMATEVWKKIALHADMARGLQPSWWQPYWLLAHARMQEAQYTHAAILLQQALKRGAEAKQVDHLLSEIKLKLTRAKSINSLQIAANRA